MHEHHLANPGFLIDMDGLLINSESIAHLVFSELCEKFGGTFTKEVHSSILGTESDYWSQYVVENCSLKTDARTFRDDFFHRFRKALDKNIALMPGARELLDWIDHSGLSKCLVTSAGLENTARNLELLGLSKMLQKRVTAETVPEGKPHPAPYLAGAKLLNKKPENCIVLEDSMNGTISGADAGCTVVAIPTEFAEKTGFQKAHFLVDDLFEALDVIQNKLILPNTGL